jgi:hypothetical protein
MAGRGCETVRGSVASGWGSELPQRARPSARPRHPQLTLRMEGLAQTLAIGPPMSTAPGLASGGTSSTACQPLYRSSIPCPPCANTSLCEPFLSPSTPAPQKTRRVLSLSHASQRCFLSHLINSFAASAPVHLPAQHSRKPRLRPGLVLHQPLTRPGCPHPSTLGVADFLQDPATLHSYNLSAPPTAQNTDAHTRP